MSSTFATSSTARAAKEHKCEECYRVIEKGEQYQRSAGNWEGSFWSLKSCSHCSAFRAIIADVDCYFMESMYGGIHAWVDSTGLSPHELHYYHKSMGMKLLSLHRWANWFSRSWRDSAGDLREVPTFAKATVAA